MNVLIVDPAGNGLDLALQIISYDHKVKVFIRHRKDGTRSKIGDGIVSRVDSWEEHIDWADLIINIDNVYYAQTMDRLKRQGYPIFSGGVESAQWELDRSRGMEIFKYADIQTIPSTEFTKYEEAIKFVQETQKRYVSKPNGDADRALSYVSKSPADMMFMLEYWKKNSKIKEEFILQEFKSGIEMAVGGWMGKGGFCSQWCENWEYKKLMNGNLGVATGEQGTVVRYTKESKMADMLLKPVEDMLYSIGYVGYVDVNCIVGDDGTPWPMEWTMRFGIPTLQIQSRLHKGDPAEWMCDLVEGFDSLRVSKDIACGVVLSIPDYPYNVRKLDEYDGFPLYGVEMKEALTNVALVESYRDKVPAMEGGSIVRKEQFVTAGTYAAVCCGTGETVEEARGKAYKQIKKIELPNSPMYRTDIGESLEESLPELQKMGYATGMEYR